MFCLIRTSQDTVILRLRNIRKLKFEAILQWTLIYNLIDTVIPGQTNNHELNIREHILMSVRARVLWTLSIWKHGPTMMLSLIWNHTKVSRPAWWWEGVVTCCVSFRQFHNGRARTGARPGLPRLSSSPRSKEVRVQEDCRRGTEQLQPLQAVTCGYLWT